MTNGTERKANKLIGILDLKTSNLYSIYNAVYDIGFDPIILDGNQLELHFDEITHLIIPGVGNYGKACNYIENTNLKQKIKKFHSFNKPILGICLGMQLLFNHSEEDSKSSGLGLIDGQIESLEKYTNERVPHIGWNGVSVIKNHPIVNNLNTEIYDFYFVHSYAAINIDKKFIIANTNYGLDFCSIVIHKNIVGLQFHPEKSQARGMLIIENFCNWKP